MADEASARKVSVLQLSGNRLRFSISLSILFDMSEQRAVARRMTRRQETGRLMPRVFSKPAWYRFSRDRRRQYLAQLAGPPSNEQAARVDTLVRLEWSALRAEAEGTLIGDREGREHRRLFDRLLADFERSLTPKSPAKPARAKLGPAQIGLDEHMAKLRERRGGGAS
jgi:hypothetical protein